MCHLENEELKNNATLKTDKCDSVGPKEKDPLE
jgi:hypothetical protein